MARHSSPPVRTYIFVQSVDVEGIIVNSVLFRRCVLVVIYNNVKHNVMLLLMRCKYCNGCYRDL